MLRISASKLLIPNLSNEPLNLLLEHPLQQLLQSPFSLSNLARNVLDNHSEVILGQVVQVQHTIDIVLILPVDNEKDHGTDHHDEVQNVHDLVVIGVSGLAELDWREFDEPRGSAFVGQEEAVIFVEVAEMERVDVAHHKQDAEVDDGHLDESEEHRCAGVQREELALALSASNRGRGDANGKRDGVDRQLTARADRYLFPRLHVRIVSKGT